METDVVTVATRVPQFPATYVSRGMHNTPINIISVGRFTKRLQIAIFAAIQGDLV